MVGTLRQIQDHFVIVITNESVSFHFCLQFCSTEETIRKHRVRSQMNLLIRSHSYALNKRLDSVFFEPSGWCYLEE